MGYVVAAVAAGAVLYWLFRPETPEEAAALRRDANVNRPTVPVVPLVVFGANGSPLVLTNAAINTQRT